VLLAVLLARAFTRPINQMSAVVQRFANGNSVGGLPVDRSDEIGVLARNFQYMHDQIKSQMDELRQRRKDLEHLARHDALTGLPNRILFEEHMEHALLSCHRDISQLALLFVDIDRFKPINDMLGHAIGDRLLAEIADRIRMAVRGSDIPARIGGDEFVVLLPTIQQRDDASTVAEKIRVSIMRPFQIDNHLLSVSASIGIAIFPEDGTELLELSIRADKAMYVAKEQGRNAVVFFSPNIESGPREHG
jgi:diguanylate cyclase (GGDEF)-like protein